MCAGWSVEGEGQTENENSAKDYDVVLAKQGHACRPKSLRSSSHKSISYRQKFGYRITLGSGQGQISQGIGVRVISLDVTHRLT